MQTWQVCAATRRLKFSDGARTFGCPPASSALHSQIVGAISIAPQEACSARIRLRRQCRLPTPAKRGPPSAMTPTQRLPASLTPLDVALAALLRGLQPVK